MQRADGATPDFAALIRATRSEHFQMPLTCLSRHGRDTQDEDALRAGGFPEVKIDRVTAYERRLRPTRHDYRPLRTTLPPESLSNE